MTQSQHEVSITRYIDAPPETVYRVYTERMEEWFAPEPWKTRNIEQDLRPGGRAASEMTGPNGESHPNEGIYLEVVPNRKIVTTNTFTVGWVPKTLKTSECDFAMVAIVTFDPEGDGTRYTAKVRHWDAEAQKQHEAMGFEQGWTMVAGQLAALAEEEARTRVAAE